MKKILLLIITLSLLPRAESKVLTGLDNLEKSGFSALKGKNIGLITNHSAIDSSGKSALDVFYNSGELKLKAIFSPEHGLKGIKEGGEKIKNSKYGDKEIPVFSLYGKTRRPTDEMLSGIDALVFDIQDIGARFYTYLTTMGYAMEEAAKRGISFIVLDRPNPAGGKIIEGPILEKNIKSFTAYFPVPVRHGLTAGEMALLHKTDRKLNLNLQIIKMSGWKREMLFAETGLPWTNPSPNIREPDAEILYPGLGCFEATNVSVGRGTDSPFLWFGAPWMKAKKIIKKLRKKIRGAGFLYEERTPGRDLYEGEKCKGIRIKITDRKNLRSLDIFIRAVYLLNKYNRDDFKAREDGLAKMLGDSEIAKMLINGEKPERIMKAVSESNASFAKNRKKFLLYK